MKKITRFDTMGVPFDEQEKSVTRRPRRSSKPTLQFPPSTSILDAQVTTVNFDKRYTSTNPRLTITREGFIFNGQFYPIKAYLPVEAQRFLRNKK